MAIGARVLLSLLIALVVVSSLSHALYEDQVGVADWYHQYIGKVNHAVFHTQKAGRKRVIVATEENVIASLDLRRGQLFWRHVLGDNDPVDQIDFALGKWLLLRWISSRWDSQHCDNLKGCFFAGSVAGGTLSTVITSRREYLDEHIFSMRHLDPRKVFSRSRSIDLSE